MVDPIRDNPVERLIESVAPVHPLAREVVRALEGAVYPLSRAHLLLLARENEAPDLILTRLSALPNRLFESEAEVTELVDEMPMV